MEDRSSLLIRPWNRSMRTAVAYRDPSSELERRGFVDALLEVVLRDLFPEEYHRIRWRSLREVFEIVE
ncbi:MAG: hypothetical protein ACE1Z6_12125 [Candidatus Methylomirabilales bacterium]